MQLRWASPRQISRKVFAPRFEPPCSFQIIEREIKMSKKAISAYIQDGGYPGFNPERPKTADLGKDYKGDGKPHDNRREHIKQGGARFDAPPKNSR
jgi:hypothetical protein